MTDADSMRFAVATQAFIKLRRLTGRVIDVSWVLQDASYAREVLRIMRAADDPGLTELATKFESLVQGERQQPAAPRLPRHELPTEESVDQHYVGHLR